MKKVIASLVISFCLGFTSCSQKKDISSINIFPLYPYKGSPTDYQPKVKKEKSFVSKYFFIKGESLATEELCSKVDSFIITYLKNDNDYVQYGDYYIYLFKESKELNENYRQGNGTDETPESHINDDLLFRYVWFEKRFIGCDFYKNGRIIKTIYNNKGEVFKHDPSIESNEPDVIFEEVPIKDSKKQ